MITKSELIDRCTTWLGPVLEPARKAVWPSARADMPPPPGTIVGHIQTTPEGVWGWYAMDRRKWVGLSEQEIFREVQGAASAYADLAGRPVKVLVSPRRWDSAQWAARRVRRATRQKLGYLPHIEDCGVRANELGLFDTFPVIGVKLAGKRSKERAAAGEIDREVRDYLGARPLRRQEMAWRLHRSAALGIEPPAELTGVEQDDEAWDPAELAEIGRAVKWDASGFSPMVRVVAERDGALVEQWVAVLTVGRMAGRDIASDEPWLAAALKWSWVDVSMCMSVHDGEDLVKDVKKKHGYAVDNVEHLQRSEVPVPPELLEKVDRSADLLRELVHGDDGSRSNSRVRMVVRIAVSASTPAECRERVGLIKKKFRKDLSIQLVHDWGSQAAALWEFMPGRPWSADSFVRQMRLDLMAHAMPNVSTGVRVVDGDYLGYTTGPFPLRPVLHDGHRLMREGKQRAGFYPILSDPGGGKSSLLATLLRSYTLAGIKSRVWDPAGGLAQLAQMPEIADDVVLVEIGKAAPGTLHIPRLIPDPRREMFPPGPEGEREWANELEIARGLRPELCTDTLLKLLPDEVRDRETYLAVTEASEVADGDPDQALAWLYANDHGQLARVIEQAKKGHGRLLFADPSGAVPELPDATMVIVTMGGVAMPTPGSTTAEWSTAERTANAALLLTAFYARRFLYDEAPGEPKVFVVDEVHRITKWKVGQAMVQGLVRMIRRLYIALYVATQHPDDVTALDPEGEAFAGEGWIGWHNDIDTAAAALELFGRSVRWADAVCKLTVINDKGDRLPGEFFAVTADGDMTQFRVDQEYSESLKQYSSTTPTEAWEGDELEDELCFVA